MDILEKVRQLITLMNDNELEEIEVQEKNTKIRVKKSGTEISHAITKVPLPADENMLLEDDKVRLLASKSADNFSEITSPMVGTFYRSGSPGGDHFVNEGDKVGADTVVCIIEAMKIMNEVKAGKSGVIVQTFLKDGDPVEFGQAMFKLKS